MDLVETTLYCSLNISNSIPIILESPLKMIGFNLQILSLSNGNAAVKVLPPERNRPLAIYKPLWKSINLYKALDSNAEKKLKTISRKQQDLHQLHVCTENIEHEPACRKKKQILH